MEKFLLILLSLSISSLINSCSSNVRAPEKELEIKNTYGKTGFMDQVQAANNKLDCVAAIATDINDYIILESIQEYKKISPEYF